MIPYEIIYKKQQGIELSRDELYEFILGYVNGSIPDYQMSAFLMAIYFQGMSERETFTLVEAMIDSGKRINLDDIDGPKIDKHSTGGVGDKVTIPLTPLAAAAGVKIPMISGRGLGHTGGTLDKLESIPGFNVNYRIEEFRERIKSVGACIMEQNDNIVPADKKMYALRDVTSTVRSIPLMCGSIMSKKIVSGIDGLVLDVKTGNGAFIREPEESRKLAEQLIAIGAHFGLNTRAIISDMNQPLGCAIGNWLEIEESLDVLKNEGPADLTELTLTLAAHMMVLAGLTDDTDAAVKILREKIADSSAYQKFLEIVESQGGDTESVEHPDRYPKASVIREIRAEGNGFVRSIDTLAMGMASVSLGAGRRKMGDKPDNTAGIILHKKLGDTVSKDEPLCTIHTNNESMVDETCEDLLRAFILSNNKPAVPPRIHATVE